MQTEAQEKRAGKRMRVRQSVDVEKVASDLDTLERIEMPGLSLDIGAGGIGLATDRPMKKGEIVKVNIPIGRGIVTVPVFTEVMWAASSGGRWRAGLRFLG